MKLIDDIIELLSNKDASLSEALLKTKVLLHRIGQKALAEWVSHELNGYPDPTQLPSYRILSAHVRVHAANIAWRYENQPIPLSHLTSEQRAWLEEARMTQSLAVLEKLVGEGTGSLRGDIPPEFWSKLGEPLERGINILRAWTEVPAATVAGIFVQVRSRLLDFLLELNEEFPDDQVDGDEIKQRSSQIDAAGMFTQAIFGDNTTVVMGSANTTSVSNTSLRGNVSALADELRAHGLPETELQSLQVAIAEDKDTADAIAKRYGPKVSAWLERMLTKVAGVSWHVEMSVAANLLTTALQNYYGWLR